MLSKSLQIDTKQWERHMQMLEHFFPCTKGYTLLSGIMLIWAKNYWHEMDLTKSPDNRGKIKLF